MKKLFFLFFILPVCLSGQEPVIEEATMSSTTSATSVTTHYSILLTFNKESRYCIDSVLNISTERPVKHRTSKIKKKEMLKIQTTLFPKKNTFKRITFSITRPLKKNIPSTLPVGEADTRNRNGAVIIYYTLKGEHKQLQVDHYELKQSSKN